MAEKVDEARVRAAVDEALRIYDDPTGQVLGVLDFVQERFGYVPDEALACLAEACGASVRRLEAVREFFRGFSATPRGRHVLVVCDGTACHTRGAPEIVQLLEESLGIRVGETTPDGEYTLLAAHCMGSCGSAPILQVDGRVFARVRLSDVVQTVRRASRG